MNRFASEGVRGSSCKLVDYCQKVDHWSTLGFPRLHGALASDRLTSFIWTLPFTGEGMR
jgi:hypothetical protein